MIDYRSPELEGMDLEGFMRLALEEADQAGRAGELPIGAVVVIDGEVIARGRAARKMHRNQLRHAELNALLEGGEKLWTDHHRALLFTTVEPCPLCLGAAVMADVPHVIFAIRDQVVQSSLAVRSVPYIRRHLRSYTGGVLEEEAKAVFARCAPQDLNYILTGSKGDLPPTEAAA